MTDIPGEAVCAWCPSLAYGSARHNDGKLYPSCGQPDHGQGWVPDETQPSDSHDDAALTVGARALYNQRGEPCDSQALREHFASLVLTATAPIIEADVRRRVAEEMLNDDVLSRGYARLMDPKLGEHPVRSFTEALRVIAAQISERGGK